MITMLSMLRDDYLDLPLFHDLTDAQLAQIKTVLEPCHFAQGQVIFKQGQPAINLYILASGEVVVNYKPYDGPSLTVSYIQPGGVFGWSAALGRDCYTSTAQASVDSDALCLRGYNLYQFCESDPETGEVIMERLASVIAERLHSTYAEILSFLKRGMENHAEYRRDTRNDG